MKTGCGDLDSYVLGGGGFERGVVVGFSCGGGEGRVVSLCAFFFCFFVLFGGGGEVGLWGLVF